MNDARNTAPPREDERTKPLLHAGRFLQRAYGEVLDPPVNAVTSQGAGVILMRFADAVAELGDTGMQVHRSYWVAHDHITRSIGVTSGRSCA